ANTIRQYSRIPSAAPGDSSSPSSRQCSSSPISTNVRLPQRKSAKPQVSRSPSWLIVGFRLGLARHDDDPAIRLLALAIRFDTTLRGQRKMDDAPLVGAHWFQRHLAPLPPRP